MGGWHSVTTSHGGPQISTPGPRVKDERYAWWQWWSSLSTAGGSSKHAHNTWVLQSGWGRTHNCNRSVSMRTKNILMDRYFLVPHRLLTEVIGLSMHPNDTHLCIELNQEPKKLEPELPGGSTLLHGGGKGTPTQPTLIFKPSKCFVPFKHFKLSKCLYLSSVLYL